ncbi:MAG: twitching motility protein PilT [Lachnospiraceae bacterium]|nr:twitching motility protein PilT [Lachnospiraceae bacterium]
MIQLIVGEKGKGKTKVLLDKVAETAQNAKGNVVFVDKDMSHIYEIKNTVRLVNISEYGITNGDEFLGFLAGLIAADHDLEDLFIDRFLRVSFHPTAEDSVSVLRKLDTLSTKFDVRVTVSLSCGKDEVPEDLQDKIIVAL